MRTVGLVGIGLLGSALAARMLAAGFRVVGYDLDVAKRDALAAAGGEVLDSALEVFRRHDTVVLALPDSDAVAALVESVAPALRAGLLIVDTSTGDPLAAEQLAARLFAAGVAYLDATIAGSSAVVRAGQGVVMIGGTESAVAAARPILACCGKQAFHLGPWGAGSRMKLVVNLVLGLNRAALAEGLTLAAALELDLPTTLATLQATAAYSAIMDAKGPKMIAADFTPQARLAQHLKDVRLILAAAERSGTGLPLSKTHRALLERAVELGCGDLDNSAVIRAFEHEAPPE
jgi:3-hydroxyisobutyrate dehydrogenase-like beta-hydroxyacid dehydrogenase